MKIVLALEDSNILLKGVSETIKNETKGQKEGFLSMLLDTLGVSLSGNILIEKGIVSAGEALILPHPLTDFQVKDCYDKEPRFNGVYSRDNLPKIIKNGAYVINLDEYADVGTHLIALYLIYFDIFGVEHVPKEIKKFIGHKSTKTNIFRIQADISIMCRYFCIEFIDFMFVGKSLINISSFFSPYDFTKNDDIILSFLK